MLLQLHMRAPPMQSTRAAVFSSRWQNVAQLKTCVHAETVCAFYCRHGSSTSFKFNILCRKTLQCYVLSKYLIVAQILHARFQL